MSHSYIYKETTFICNSDLSGYCTIVTKDNTEIEVKCSDIKDFVIHHLKYKFISNIEDLDNDEFIKLLLNVK